MSQRPINPIVLLAIAVAVAGLRPAWLIPHDHGDHDLHSHGASIGHRHEHSHGDLTHTHFHHHHPGDSHDGEDPDHHHGIFDHPEDGPMARWVAPRRVTVDGPPVAASTMLAGTLPSDWGRSRRGKPPPRADRHHHLDLRLSALRITVLRL